MSATRTAGPLHVTAKNVGGIPVKHQLRDRLGRVIAYTAWNNASDEVFPRGEKEAEANAAFLAKAWNQSDDLLDVLERAEFQLTRLQSLTQDRACLPALDVIRARIKEMKS